MSTDIIGIDLGTTHCCVAVYEQDSIEVLANKQGQRTTPSWVGYNEYEHVVGETAKDHALFDPENTVYDMKRLIGRRYNDETVQDDIKRWAFTVICDDELPKVKVNWNDTVSELKPEEISAIILKDLKNIAESYLDREVTKAVITVPAYFSDSQRQATLDAGKIAGLEVVRLFNEPTAAALAYAMKRNDILGNILVFDLGGGTIDVSIVKITDSRFTVKATKGDTHLGGQDFTNKLFDYMTSLVSKKCGKNILDDKDIMIRLRNECEIAKKKLSFSPKHKIFIDSIIDGKHLNEEITREKFCELNVDLFEQVLQPIQGALQAADLTKDDINKIIMVGGSSRIPKIKEALKHFFINKEICVSINPDEAIACGAALYAAIHDGIRIRNRNNFIIEDVIPISLGIDSIEGTVFVIPRNSTIPISKNRTFATVKDNQIWIRFTIYEGDSSDTKKNTFLGEFCVRDIPPKPKGEEKFNVIFVIDNDGILKVSATNISTGNKMSTTINRRIGCRFN